MHQRRPIRIAFFGTPEFALPSLRALAKHERFSIVEVITRPDERAGRGMRNTPPPIKTEAEKLGITVYQPVSFVDTSAIEHLRNLQADLFVVVAYGRILPSKILSLPPNGVVNVHPSLLPRYRGPSPIQAAIQNGDESSGVSIILLEDGSVDAGPILAQKSVTISPMATYASLSALLAEEAGKLLSTALDGYVSGSAAPIQQDDAAATTTNLITRADGEIDFSQSAVEIERKTRAFTPWPGVFIFFRDKRLKILSSHIAQIFFDEKPGTILAHKKTPILICGTGALVLDSVQLEGKSPLTGKDFASGYLKS